MFPSRFSISSAGCRDNGSIKATVVALTFFSAHALLMETEASADVSLRSEFEVFDDVHCPIQSVDQMTEPNWRETQEQLRRFGNRLVPKFGKLDVRFIVDPPRRCRSLHRISPEIRIPPMIRPQPNREDRLYIFPIEP